MNILSSMGEGVRTGSFSTLFSKKNNYFHNEKLNEKQYFYEIGKIYLCNLKKIFEDNLVVGLTASK